MAKLTTEEQYVLNTAIRTMYVAGIKGSTMQAVAEDEKLQKLLANKLENAQEAAKDLQELLDKQNQ